MVLSFIETVSAQAWNDKSKIIGESERAAEAVASARSKHMTMQYVWCALLDAWVKFIDLELLLFLILSEKKELGLKEDMINRDLSNHPWNMKIVHLL